MKKGVASVLVASTLIAGCVTDGTIQKQDVGTVLGGAAGIVAGSFLGGGTGRYVAMAIGGLAGAYLGRQLGSMLDEDDQKAVNARTSEALAAGKDGSTITWSNPEKGVTAEITPSATREVKRDVPLVRKREVAPVPALEIIGEQYAAKKSANVRAAPTTDAAVTSGLRVGDVFTAVGKVQDSDWIVVAQNQRTIGYVHASLVGPVTIAKVPEGVRPAVDLDELMQAKGVDLDAEGLVAENVATVSTCRTLDYKVTSKGETASEQHTACKSADGAWEIL